jgi:UDP-3-O-[3-hydroxymyristoyl] glucosamine N-acyltransferase
LVLTEGSKYILLTSAERPECNGIQLVCDNPRLAFAELLNAFFAPDEEPGIHASAAIHPSAKIADSASIGAFVYVGANSVIGEDTRIEPFVHIAHDVHIGARCHVMAHASIGSAGFALERRRDGSLLRIPHSGGVRIEDDVWIGNATAIASGTLHATRIGAGTHIYNLVHVAHNVTIGSNCQIIASAVLAGSVQIEDDAYVALNATVLQKLVIGAGALLGSGSTVMQSIRPGMVAFGTPAREMRERRSSDG